jgi:hypothetical protein
MVFSKLNHRIEYKEDTALDKEDKNKEVNMYHIVLNTPKCSNCEIVVAFGSEKHHDDICYYPLYLVKKNKKVIKIGVLEFNYTDKHNYVNHEGAIDLEYMEKNGRAFDPLLFSYVDETLLEKNVPTLMDKSKSVHASVPRIPSSRMHLFSKDNRVMDASLVNPLEEENKKKAKEIRDEFHTMKTGLDTSSQSWSWVQEFMENPYYKINTLTMKSGVLPIIVDVYNQLGMRTDEEKLLKEIVDSLRLKNIWCIID